VSGLRNGNQVEISEAFFQFGNILVKNVVGQFTANEKCGDHDLLFRNSTKDLFHFPFQHRQIHTEGKFTLFLPVQIL